MSLTSAAKATLDGNSLTCRILSDLGRAGSKLSICPMAMNRVVKSRAVVQGLVDRGFNEGHVAYGINTGFGLFSDVVIGQGDLGKLQENLIRSHCAGVGEPLTKDQTRRLLALRMNVLAKVTQASASR